MLIKKPARSGRQPVHDLVGQVVARLLRRRGEGVDHLARIASGAHGQHGHLQPGGPALGEGAKPPAIDGFASQARQLEQLLDLDLGEREIVGAQLGDDAGQPEPGRGEHRVVLAGHQQADIGRQTPGNAASVRCDASANWASSMTTAAAAGRSARSRASESTSSGSSHEGRSRISAASLPMAGHRAARLAVSRDQNRAGSPSRFIAGQPGNLRVRRRGPLREQAGLAEAGRSHQEHQRLASGLQPAEQGRALHPGPGGPGHSDQLALDGHAVVGLDGTPPGGLGPRHPPPARRRQVHPAAGDPWVMPGHHPQPRVGVSATHARAGDVTIRPRVVRGQDPWYRRASRRRGAERSGHDGDGW